MGTGNLSGANLIKNHYVPWQDSQSVCLHEPHGPNIFMCIYCLFMYVLPQRKIVPHSITLIRYFVVAVSIMCNCVKG